MHCVNILPMFKNNGIKLCVQIFSNYLKSLSSALFSPRYLVLKHTNEYEVSMINTKICFYTIKSIDICWVTDDFSLFWYVIAVVVSSCALRSLICVLLSYSYVNFIGYRQHVSDKNLLTCVVSDATHDRFIFTLTSVSHSNVIIRWFCLCILLIWNKIWW